MLRLLLSCILSISSVLAQEIGPHGDEKSLEAKTPKAAEKPGGLQAAKPQKDETARPAKKNTVQEKQQAQEQTESAGEKAQSSFTTINPQNSDELKLHEDLLESTRSLGSWKKKEEPFKKDALNEELWEDFKLPLIIVGCVIFYFIPTILGMRRNDFKKLFLINLLAGWTVVGWVFAMVRAFSMDIARQPRRKHRPSSGHDVDAEVADTVRTHKHRSRHRNRY